MSERVLVAMSGGVDSSLAAALLVEQGCEVVGVTMRVGGGGSRCCSLDDVEDARRVAARLGIRFYVADYADAFRREVIEPFADAYLAGRTPIPCVACNGRFKFHRLLERARALGADAVATGHYARIESDPAGGAPMLLRGADPAKDQSYFLFDLGPAQLARARFPVGALDKAEVRARARELGLAVADKPESMEICFVPDGDYAAVVEALRPGAAPGPGDLVDEAGRALGRHAGVHRFTVGQRRGLGLALGERVYVKALDARRNRVVVAPRERLAARGARLAATSWVAGAPPPAPVRARVRVRHRHDGADARIEPGGAGVATVRFDAPVEAVTPGQAAVFYDGERVLGGGWIEEALA
jgi:tRNA-specific 2-thiouridylase